ncbi:MAG TPA: polysaccharide biosynthesis tyrosine autokinase, partial [Roseimicrobium sp.]|nr:polysaccharide biosynthesis tyrosine autokinase [Roseimicrobium sp.]
GESRYVELKLSQRTKEAELARLQSTLKPLHPYMVRLKRELADISQQIQFQFDLIKEKREDLIASLKKDEGSYLPLIEAQRNIVIESRGIQLQHEKLKEDEANYKTVLDGLQKSLQAIDLAPSNEERIDIIQAGVGSPTVVDPDRGKRMITNGALAGFGLGIAIVFLLHRLDDRLELAEDIEADLDEPVLGQIPQQDASLLKSGRVLVTELDQHNLFSEAIRGVRSAVMFGGNEGSKQVLLVTSAVPGDGKTTFTVNFAATLANAGNRVLLVDADLRRGNVHNYFQHQREPGITEVLSGELHWHDVVRATPIKTLQVITSGQLPPNPGELLISPVMRQFIEEARGEYDHILFDCPPLTAIDDTFCLLSSSDGLMFVVKAGQTSMRFAKNALDAVRQRGAKILGIVLNGITTDHPSYYYNYYYHAYYNKELTQTPGKSVKPATKMATRRPVGNSIAAQAHARVGHDTTAEEIAAEEHRKAEEFKARRAQRQGQDSSADQSASAPTQTKDKRPGDVG